MGAPSDNDPTRKAAQLDEAPVDDGWTTGSPVHNDRTTAGLYVDPASVGRLTAGLGKNPFAPSPAHQASTDLDADGLARGSNHDRITTKPAVHTDDLTTAPDQDPISAAAADADHDPTTAALDALSVDADNDRTTIEPPPVRTIDSTVAALDRTMAELEGDAVVEHDRTKSGLAVATPAPRPRFSLLQPGRGTVPLEKERALVQPERSPLDFVMRDMDPAAPQQSHTSGDSSRFVASFMGDQPRPVQVQAEAPVITAMEPVLRRARKRRQWIAGGAAALVVAVLGTAVAMKMGGADEPPRTAASEAANLGETQAAAPSPTNVATPTAATASETPAVPPASNVATTAAASPNEVAAAHDPSSEPTVPQAPPPAQVETVALATTTTAKPTSSLKPAIAKTVATKDTAEKKPAASKATTAKKTVATKDATPKKSSTTKSTTDKKASEKKSTTAKKSVATSTTTKKSAKPATTAKKPTAKKVSTAKATTAKKPAAKSSSSTKKPATKTPTTTKKTPAKKPTRS